MMVVSVPGLESKIPLRFHRLLLGKVQLNPLSTTAETGLKEGARLRVSLTKEFYGPPEMDEMHTLPIIVQN